MLSTLKYMKKWFAGLSWWAGGMQPRFWLANQQPCWKLCMVSMHIYFNWFESEKSDLLCTKRIKPKAFKRNRFSNQNQ